ncbi:MAG: hypothetical protein VYE22_41600 [Myxococcota bacterium]|nr:hypothetical protein [Myxococcota bacterium]
MKLRIIGCALALMCAGCGGSQDVGETTGGPLVEPEPEPAGPVSASGTEEARAAVGEAGGTLSLTNGARLEIPAGALQGETEVALQVGADGRAFGDAERQRPLGPMINVVPAILATEGTSFSISIPEQPLPSGFESSDLAFAMEEVDDDQRAIDTLGTQTRWQFYPVRVEGGRFRADVGGLPGHRLQFGVAR